MDVMVTLFKRWKLFAVFFILFFVSAMTLFVLNQSPKYEVRGVVFTGRLAEFGVKENSFIDLAPKNLVQPKTLSELIKLGYGRLSNMGRFKPSLLKESGYLVLVSSYAESYDKAELNLKNLVLDLQKFYLKPVSENRSYLKKERQALIEREKRTKDYLASSRDRFNLNLMELASMNQVLLSKVNEALDSGMVSEIELRDLKQVPASSFLKKQAPLVILSLFLSLFLSLSLVILVEAYSRFKND